MKVMINKAKDVAYSVLTRPSMSPGPKLPEDCINPYLGTPQGLAKDDVQGGDNIQDYE